MDGLHFHKKEKGSQGDNKKTSLPNPTHSALWSKSKNNQSNDKANMVDKNAQSNKGKLGDRKNSKTKRKRRSERRKPAQRQKKMLKNSLRSHIFTLTYGTLGIRETSKNSLLARDRSMVWYNTWI